MFGEDINFSEPILLTQSELESVKGFNCGNSSINEYLKEYAVKDKEAVTFFIKDEDKNENRIAFFYTLNCTGVVINKNYGYKDEIKDVEIKPAVEIKMFALDEKYMHTPYFRGLDTYRIGHQLMYELLERIKNDLTTNTIGADLVVLYSVPEYVSFYEKCDFKVFEEKYMKNSEMYTADCIPMYRLIRTDE